MAELALTHPYCWPQVQRGGERLFADLARYLAGAGHQVTTISAGAPGRDHAPDGSRSIRFRGIEPAWLRARDVDQPVTYLPQAARALRAGDYDVVHGLYHLDGLAARWARAPYVLSVQGMPLRANLLRRPVHRKLFGASVGRAASILAVSAAAAAAFEREFGHRAEPVLNGVFIDDFADASRGGRRGDRPSILFPASPGDPRKRLEVLLEAAARLTDRWDGLVVRIAAEVTGDARAIVAASPVPVEHLGGAPPQAMPEAYATSWVTCLPAVREAFGLVLVESLSAGTPAVGVRDGGVPEILTESRWLAEPDDVASLSAALDRALADASSAFDRCREMAEPFDWSVRGPDFEAVYDRVSRSRSGPAPAR